MKEILTLNWIVDYGGLAGYGEFLYVDQTGCEMDY
jgi:hypothetical protein